MTGILDPNYMDVCPDDEGTSYTARADRITLRISSSRRRRSKVSPPQGEVINYSGYLSVPQFPLYGLLDKLMFNGWKVRESIAMHSGDNISLLLLVGYNPFSSISLPHFGACGLYFHFLLLIAKEALQS